jgi:hypothetical protein
MTELALGRGSANNWNALATESKKIANMDENSVMALSLVDVQKTVADKWKEVCKQATDNSKAISKKHSSRTVLSFAVLRVGLTWIKSQKC